MRGAGGALLKMTVEFVAPVVQTKTQTPGSGVLGVWSRRLLRRFIRPLALSLDFFPNSEGSQQDRADKKKHGAHRQDIELQGKVHVSCLLGFWRKCSRGAPRSEAPNVLRCGRFPAVFALRELSH